MEKAKTNWRIDAALLALFWISFFPDFTGLEVHQWIGIAAVGLALGHLLAHWSWVENVTLGFFSRAPSRARIYYLLDLGVMAGFIMILTTGLLISTWLDLPIYDLAAWTHVHLMASVFTLLLVVLKIVLHWRWVANTVRRHVLDPVFARPKPGSLPRPANPVDRRDFLKLAGVLGAATVLTVHGLFDETDEAQAQAPSPDAQPAGAGAVPQTVESTAEPSTPSAASPVVQAPTDTAVPAACVVRCPNGCSYPGRCRRYTDANANGLCDNGECL
jgi:hypothetical protein